MAFRLWSKAVLMTLREKKLFIIFTLVYTALIFLTSFFIQLTQTGGGSEIAPTFVILFFSVSLFLSLLYAYIIVSRNRRMWATLKCIGYTNSNVNTIVSGIILFTTIMGFIIVLEVLFHYTAIVGYLQSTGMASDLPLVLVGFVPVVITSILFIAVQLFAIFLANRRILKVRPIVALKKVGE